MAHGLWLHDCGSTVVLPIRNHPYQKTETMSKHRLYYSTRCRFCQAFLEELASTPFVPEFQLICVDPSPSRPPLPSWLKSVPSLQVTGEANPRVGPGPVNNWLFERKLGGEGPKTPQQAMEQRNVPLSVPVYSPDVAPRPNATSRTSAQPPSSSNPAGASTGDGPEAYLGSEMGSGKWSDNYSFVGDTFTAEKGYNPISRNFESLIDMSNGCTAAKSQPVQQSKRTMKEEKLLKDFEAFTASRDRDIPQQTARQ